VTLIANEKAIIAWNGSDFVKIVSDGGGGVVTQATPVSLGIVYGKQGVTKDTPVAYGYLAANSTTGIHNTAVGYQALAAAGAAANNVAIGYGTAKVTTTEGNTAVGSAAMFRNTTGGLNTCVGFSAGSNIEGGSSNTYIGYDAGNTFVSVTGSNNTSIGASSGPSSSSVSNTVTLGNGSITTLRCAVTSITAISDIRDKKHVVDIPAGLSFVEKLRPVSFKWAMRNLYEDPTFTGKQDIPEFGFIAQDLQSVQNETGIIVPNLVSVDNPDRLEVAPGNLIPILVKAIQELTARVQALEAK
jgi:hypothetical protein